jgi:hypothetical protein
LLVVWKYRIFPTKAARGRTGLDGAVPRLHRSKNYDNRSENDPFINQEQHGVLAIVPDSWCQSG